MREPFTENCTSAESDNLYIQWGIVNGTDEEGNPVYIWADETTPAENGIGKIDHTGHYTAIGGGICEIALKAYTGYPIGNDNFYEISSFIRTFKVTNGIPVESIEITATGATSNGELNRVQTVNINGQDYTYAQPLVQRGAAAGLAGDRPPLAEPVNRFQGRELHGQALPRTEGFCIAEVQSTGCFFFTPLKAGVSSRKG